MSAKSKRDYIAVSNFIRNTCGISRDDIKEMVREIVKDIVKEEVSNFFQTNHFQNLIAVEIRGYNKADFKNTLKKQVVETFQNLVAQEVEKIFKVEISKKEN